ncbi:Protein pelota-like [Stylophora pistillata]|uniref:Protein pelota-like n=1 Tax=Stylophora pistillata TaxID=50429 RepID=A0A2B4S4D8_STYPI|nr:Protein pelota-like [Stylophora pistillata]
MKLIAKNFEKDSSGSVVLVPDEAEDMWHAYNLIAVGDRLRSTTIRRVQTESATGSVSSNKVRTTLSIAVEGVEFDTQACMLRIKGRNVQENQYVKMGAYHTIDLELNRKFTLIKEYWDIIALERVELACDPAQHADLGAILLHEGLCHICLVTSSMTIVRAKIDMNIPRKRKGFCGQHDKGLFRFYDAIIQGILSHINFEVIKCIIVASPGFVKAHSSSGHKHSLKEVLADPTVTAKLADTKASSEVKALDNFFMMLQTEPDRAYYGVTHVEEANEALAIETLLVTDELFRSTDLPTRKRYVKLVESVKENGGEVRVFSSLHVSGERMYALLFYIVEITGSELGQLSGVAAILRFPMPDIADDEGSADSEED